MYVPVVTLSGKDNHKMSKILSKEFERSVYWNQYKTKKWKKNCGNEDRYYLKSNFVGVSRWSVLIYKNRDGNAEIYNAKKYYLKKGIIDKSNIINGKNVFDQPISSDTKRYEKMKKLTTE